DSPALHIDEVHAEGLQSFAQLAGLLEVPTAFFPIRGGNANEQRQACGPNLPHRLYDLENDADAILEAAAKLILPKIAEGRKELVQQISMGGVNLQDFESRRASALRRPSKRDRKSTRLNSSHGSISYAVFCLKKKKDN